MVKANNLKEEMLKQKAEKHIQICIKSERISKKKHPNYGVYIATHPQAEYKKIEKASGKDFWSLILYSERTNPGKIKEPDIILTESNRVKYVIEVKWGALNGSKDTDIKELFDVIDNIERIRYEGCICTRNGPVVSDGYLNNKKNYKELVYSLDNSTKILVVSDFALIKDKKPNIFSQLKKELNNIVILADINRRVDDIPSLQEII